MGLEVEKDGFVKKKEYFIINKLCIRFTLVIRNSSTKILNWIELDILFPEEKQQNFRLKE